MSYKKKDVVALAYEANKKRIRCEAQVILAGLLNDALAEMDAQFMEALNRGEVLSIAGSREELRGYLRRAAERELGPAPGGQRALPGKK